ncbi:MAG: hypothetical protein ACXQTI_04180 [Candidatus Nezhaarchaeales archaeon]
MRIRKGGVEVKKFKSHLFLEAESRGQIVEAFAGKETPDNALIVIKGNLGTLTLNARSFWYEDGEIFEIPEEFSCYECIRLEELKRRVRSEGL